jgi:hypothetical protein
MLSSSGLGAAALTDDGFFATQGLDELLHFERQIAKCKLQNAKCKMKKRRPTRIA